MEQRTQQLLKRLSFLGYHSFEIRRILQEAHSGDGIVSTLEKYEQLASKYLQSYSK
ncbi:hypothetical protein [Anaerosporomusa subterranea]|uniref:hypothetical protein n=1 Tax=Anaerosporomusa subterranea TaxID=1794912 RepID=UPI0018D3A731|nr:hypothetical protein [Anaerosporomusa subterranea]